MVAVVSNPDELSNVAQDVLTAIPKKDAGATVLALSGELGSGKTTFVQALARELGVTASVTSPTFVIEKLYKTDDKRFSRLVHIDAYRLDSADELEKLNWNNTVSGSRNLIAVEWAERVHDILPDDALAVHFETLDETTRKITY